ncbi:hypothetical protein NDU88_003207 [Pleurodeles waltl]|uniref:Uncharacterized protein n=1 Tax=Pleurodeles waltl TaxID=8319 RepID=A0AAV7W1R8_PLEWA|nr:hypothetical protein NDU88_003207 [Pleurodeles waltl]
MAVAGLPAVLSVVEGGTSPSPAASDSCPLGLLLLAVVLLVVQVVVLAAVQVAVLSVVGVGTSPSPAASYGCPLGLLLLLTVVLAVVQVAVLSVVGEAPALPLQPRTVEVPWLVFFAQMLLHPQAPNPSCLLPASVAFTLALAAVVPFLPLADGGASLLSPAGVPFLPLLADVPSFPLLAAGASFPLLAGGASFPLLAGVIFLPLLAGGPFRPLAGGAGKLAVLTGVSLEPLTPAVAAETTVAVDWVSVVLGLVLATLARSEGRWEGQGIGQGWRRKTF